MPFGKFRGQLPANVPTWYLQWACKTWTRVDPDVRKAMGEALAERGVELPVQPPAREVAAVRFCRCPQGAPTTYGWHEDRGGKRTVWRECSVCARPDCRVKATAEHVAAADAAADPCDLLTTLILADDQGVLLASDGRRADFARPEDWCRATPQLRRTLYQCRHRLGKMLKARRRMFRPPPT
jgi:hypothetical protein